MHLKVVKLQKGDRVKVPLKDLGEFTAVVKDVTEYNVLLRVMEPIRVAAVRYNPAGSSLSEAVSRAFPGYLSDRVSKLSARFTDAVCRPDIELEFRLLLQ